MYVGVGRKFQIDMEGGAENSGMWDFITAAPRVLYDVVTFAHYRGHLTKAYQESFLDAAARFKQTGCI